MNGYHQRVVCRALWMLALLAALASASAFAAEPSAKDILDLAGVRHGLCLHLGCGREASAALTAELAAGSNMLVHGIALDDASLARARKAIEEKGMPGRAMVEKVAVNPLPYLRDLADLVVIEDMATLSKQGVTMEEVLRVTAPKGVVCVLNNGRWTKSVKPRPAEMDEWTHPQHGPDGNLVSKDSAMRLPIGLRWLDGFPVNITGFAANRAWVVAGGRVFTLGVNEVENISPRRVSSYNEWVEARNAWNGLPLWKIDTELKSDGTSIIWENYGPLAADDARVYSVKKDKLIGIDAATGEIVKTFDTKYTPARILLLGKTVVAACWEAKTRVKDDWLWLPKAGTGAVEAFDTETGTKKWSFDAPAFRIVGSDGVVYVLTRSDTAPQERQVIAIDLATGAERWRVPNTAFGEGAVITFNCCGPGYVAVSEAHGKESAIYVLSAADGKVLWQAKPARPNWAPVVDGLLVYGGKKLDPMTGEAKGEFKSGYLGGQAACQARSITPFYMLSSYGVGELYPQGGPGTRARSFTYLGVRPACVESMVPANGMLYISQNNCKCVPGAVYGFLAAGPSGEWPEPADFEKPRPVEKGPAFGTLDAAAKADADWPTYRHDAERTAATPSKLPEKLKELWKTPVAKSAEGPLAAAWKAQLASCLTPPVAAGGLVFIAARDAGQVVALDASTGKKAWLVSLGSRLDTPPTIYRGLCVVGCHDGWVYALRAKDGQLAWRTRVAPWERRLVAFGAVESVWPAIGTVVAHENMLYANAGRTSESDGGIALVALDPATGAAKWAKAIAPGAIRLNDILRVRDGSLAWRYLKMDPKTGAVTDPADLPTAKDYGGGKGVLEGAIIDNTWTLTGNRRAGRNFTVGRMPENICAWNETLAATPKAAISLKDDANLWPAPTRAACQVESIVLTGNAVIYAGRVTGRTPLEATGFVWVVSAADGKSLADFRFDAAVTFDGVAVAGGNVYVSLQDGNVVCIGKGE